MQKQQIKIILNLFVVLNFQEILHQTYFQPINVISDHSVRKKVMLSGSHTETHKSFNSRTNTIAIQRHLFKFTPRLIYASHRMHHISHLCACATHSTNAYCNTLSKHLWNKSKSFVQRNNNNNKFQYPASHVFFCNRARQQKIQPRFIPSVSRRVRLATRACVYSRYS